MIRCPLVSLQGSGDLLHTDGFICPSWTTGGIQNGLFELNKISKFKFELSGSDAGPQSVITSGSFLIDLLIPGGVQETDVTAPPAPAGVSAVAGTFSNIITWNDIPNTTGEKYNLYYSKNTITDITAPGVEVVSLGVPRGTQLFEHLLRAPGTNQSVSYYYAINCLKKNGKTGPAGNTPATITNTAKGVPTIKYFAQPWTAFQADGVLSKWTDAGVQKFSIAQSSGGGFVAPNTIVTNDADCSADAYIAMDKDYLYVAFDVTDDILSFNPAIASYFNDAPDLFIGTYNWHGAPHGSYQRGAKPDFHFRFAQDRVIIDGLTDSLYLTNTVNYSFTQKFPTGYITEAKLAWTDIARKRNVNTVTQIDSVFVPQLGYRTPIDFELNDADATATREGILCYSPYNMDQSYSTTSRWLWTWIGNQWDPTGINDKVVTPFEYSLSQNYPNPFNPSTTIRFSIKNTGLVTLKVYNILGKEIMTLVNSVMPAGPHSASFNATKLPSGVYMYEIISGGFRDVHKMILMK